MKSHHRHTVSPLVVIFSLLIALVLGVVFVSQGTSGFKSRATNSCNIGPEGCLTEQKSCMDLMRSRCGSRPTNGSAHDLIEYNNCVRSECRARKSLSDTDAMNGCVLNPSYRYGTNRYGPRCEGWYKEAKFCSCSDFTRNGNGADVCNQMLGCSWNNGVCTGTLVPGNFTGNPYRACNKPNLPDSSSNTGSTNPKPQPTVETTSDPKAPTTNTSTQPTGPVQESETVVVKDPVRVHKSIADQTRRLLEDAEAQGVVLYGPANGQPGWRDPQDQINLRREKCPNVSVYQIGGCPGYAAAGTSRHEFGLAIDFVCNGGAIPKRAQPGENVCYDWLVANAGKYGFKEWGNGDRSSDGYESWHWSTDGR